MIISRWQATVVPSIEQIKYILETEGYDYVEESFSPQTKIGEHRHPFTEVRYIVNGELLFNIAGNQFLLRSGDRVEIPSNTKHSYFNNSNSECVCVYAQKPF